MNIYDDNEKDDFFENSDISEKKEEPKKPVYTPDDPRYWEEPEDEFEHLRPAPGSRWKLWAWIAGVAIITGILWGGYIRLFNPYVQQASQYGYIEVGKYFITPRHIKYQLGLEDLQPMPVIRTLGRINKSLGRIEDGLLTLMVESRYIHGLKICRTELQNFIVRFCSGDSVQTPIKER